MNCERPSSAVLLACSVALFGASAGVSHKTAEGGPEVLFHTSFDDKRPGLWPTEWLTSGGQWTIVGDRNRVAQQSDGKLKGSAMAALTWINYDLSASASCLDHREPWGMGVFAYWQDAGNYYRLSNFGDRLHLIRCLDGTAEVLASAPVQVGKGQPWTFRLAIEGGSGMTHLRGRAWLQGQPEPAEWQVDGYDFSKLRRGGAAGVWCANARCRFDEIHIEPTGPAPTRNGDGKVHANFDNGVEGQPPAGWFPLGGDWRLTGKGNLALEQRSYGAPLTFDANTFCLLAEWTNYTASARVRCLTGREGWGFGLAGYYQNEDNHYRLCSAGNTLFLARRQADEGATLLAETPFAFRDRTDYTFTLRLQAVEGKTLLSGKVWPSNEAEPTDWTIAAEDASDQRFTAGAVALIAVDSACEFDDVRVVKSQ